MAISRQLNFRAISVLGLLFFCGIAAVHDPFAFGLRSECELINLPRCGKLQSGFISLPNPFGHWTQLEIVNSSNYKFLERASEVLMTQAESVHSEEASNVTFEDFQRCEQQIHQLTCAVIAPKCFFLSRLSVSSVPPCKRVCVEVRERCSDLLISGGLQWPVFLDCQEFIECDIETVCRGRRSVLPPVSKSGERRHHFHRLKRPARLPPFQFKHHSQMHLKRMLRKIVHACPDITRFYEIGKSVERRPLWVIEFSDNPGQHDELEPEVKWVGGIHGNEVLGREMLIAFAHYLCREWKSGNQRIVNMIKTTRIHLMPTMNPDGYHKAGLQPKYRRDWLTGRYSKKGFDLNRNFPDLTADMYHNEKHGGPNHHLEIPMEYWRSHREDHLPEIHAVIKWIKNYPFLLSAQLHGGELVANYPYDIRRISSGKWRWLSETPDYAACPDDALFRMLASTFAESHGTMANPILNRCDGNFGRTGGITNGADWYTVHGGMQDFNYLHTNCYEILIEIGCQKFPPAYVLPEEWINNKEAFIAYTEKAHVGIKGLVTDAYGVRIPDAEIQVEGIEHHITTTENGEYWRLLTPGSYYVSAVHPEYRIHGQFVEVLNKPNTTEAKRVDFVLHTEEEWNIKLPKIGHLKILPALVTPPTLVESFTTVGNYNITEETPLSIAPNIAEGISVSPNQSSFETQKFTEPPTLKSTEPKRPKIINSTKESTSTFVEIVTNTSVNPQMESTSETITNIPSVLGTGKSANLYTTSSHGLLEAENTTAVNLPLSITDQSNAVTRFVRNMTSVESELEKSQSTSPFFIENNSSSSKPTVMLNVSDTSSSALYTSVKNEASTQGNVIDNRMIELSTHYTSNVKTRLSDIKFDQNQQTAPTLVQSTNSSLYSSNATETSVRDLENDLIEITTGKPFQVKNKNKNRNETSTTTYRTPKVIQTEESSLAPQKKYATLHSSNPFQINTSAHGWKDITGKTISTARPEFYASSSAMGTEHSIESSGDSDYKDSPSFQNGGKPTKDHRDLEDQKTDHTEVDSYRLQT
uniref:carboxypeptidase Z-like n=1 Tax=Ciona intestinalis TaxID=7719 RepID=UPI000180B0AF|nr:carboxypeptidase Z-like [Ciona intestinalis]|eukprot:XP_026695250.1 carboxypeptidase Z-like [Ciona intestinalis]